MTKDDELERLVRLLGTDCGLSKPTPAVARGVGAARVRAVRRQPNRQVRVHPPERANGERISQHSPEETISLVFLRPKSVAVLDSRAPAGSRTEPGAESIVDSSLLSKYLAAPTIMIARDHHHGNAGVGHIGERGESTKSLTGNDRPPLEPEFEQVAVDDERRAWLGGDVPKKGDDGALDVGRCEPEVRVGDDVARRCEHARILPALESLYKHEIGDDLRPVTIESRGELAGATATPLYHDVEFRVRYAETDQMGVVYHANYLVWCEVGRTDFIRARGMSYSDMEKAGVGLAVSELSARYHSAARYDDMIRIRTTLADVRSRGITFDYLITHAGTGHRLVTARTALVSIDAGGRPIALPASIRALFARE